VCGKQNKNYKLGQNLKLLVVAFGPIGTYAYNVFCEKILVSLRTFKTFLQKVPFLATFHSSKFY
jgi:hypothetical protein